MSEQTLVEGKGEALAVFSPVEAMIAEYAEENKTLVFDYRDPKGNKEARSHVFQLRKVKGKIADVHKQAKADALEVCRLLDGHKNKLIGKVEDMIAVHEEPIKQIEREEAEAEAERQRKIKEAEEKAERERLAEIERREKEIAEREAKIQAEEAKRMAEERARQAEDDRIAREKRIAEEAKAKAEAEHKAALEAAEKKRLADIEAEKRRAEAERQRVIAEQQAKELAEIRRKEAEAEAEKKRIENKRHRAKVEGEVLNYLVSFDGEDIASDILAALVEGRIPHVTINY